MKLLIETTGPFMLLDPQSGHEIHHNRPTVVPTSNFVQSRTAVNQIKVISNEVPDKFTDEDFKKFWIDCDKDHALAVQSFMSSFAPKESKKEAPKTIAKELVK